MNIITLTLSPTFDIHCTCQKFEAQKENTVSFISREPAGKGINISRALSANGIPNVAIAVLGSENAEEYKMKLKKQKVSLYEIVTDGCIRESLTIHTKNELETRVSFEGISIDEETLTKASNIILSAAKKDDIVTVTGRMPKGINMPRVKELITKLKNSGVKVVIDSKSFSLKDLISLKPFLIKPNEEEISEYLCSPVRGFADAFEQAVQLYNQGIENVMISLGEQGALLICKDGAFVAIPPKINSISTVGAGDSTLAGFLAAYKNNRPYSRCLINAVAYGTASCLTEGTNPPLPDDIDEISERISIKRVIL